ncbi:MAG: methyltransferase domain-containing protein [Vicinamibacteria bacterium]
MTYIRDLDMAGRGATYQEHACPACGADLLPSADRLVCTGCARTYPVLQGVPLLLPDIAVTAGPEPAEEFVADIARVAAPADDGAARPLMRQLFSTRIVFPDRELGMEGHRFLERLRASGHSVRNPDGSQPAQALPEAEPAATEDARRVPRVELRLLTLPAAVLSGRRFGLQVRLTNHGPGALTSRGTTPFHLSYFARPPGRSRNTEGIRTALLVDLPAGSSLSLPVIIDGADGPGEWTYEITPVVEHVAWLHGAALHVTVPVLPKTAPDPLDVDWPKGDAPRDYGSDHVHGIDLLNGWLQERLAGHPEPRILELGGNSAPQIGSPRFALRNARRYNLDIDPFGLVFGTVQRALGGGEPVADVLGDGTRLPFAAGAFDAIVMFATLHHFPDPVSLLRHLRRKLAPGGLICVLCEPMGHVTRDTLPEDFRHELLGGICEQAFEAWEYRQFFLAAGLRVAHALWDVGSLKVALEVADREIDELAGRVRSAPALTPQSARPSAVSRFTSAARGLIARVTKAHWRRRLG